MTREEAKSCICTIKMLQKLAYNIHGVMDVVDADNCKKIIKALEQEPCEDCISRHTVLNTLFYKSDNNCEVVLNKELQDRIKALPSVKPAADNNVLTCEDAISRQAAIDCLDADFTIDGKENMETVVDYINGAFKQIKELPSVTPQPKTGHWITEIKSDLRGDMWPTNPKCSECGGEPYFSKTIYSYNFCPYCGAKMVELQESEG